jgi:hypothetical protein
MGWASFWAIFSTNKSGHTEYLVKSLHFARLGSTALPPLAVSVGKLFNSEFLCISLFSRQQHFRLKREKIGGRGQACKLLERALAATTLKITASSPSAKTGAMGREIELC